MSNKLEITYFPIADLRHYHRNYRTGDIPELIKSLQIHGQYRAISVNIGTHTGRPYEVLVGNQTMTAARELGWDTIGATTVDVDDQEAAKIVAVDNRLSELGHTDDRLLLEILSGLDDLDGTGYDQDYVDHLEDIVNADDEPLPDVRNDDTTPSAPPKHPVTKPGDIWHLGPHRIICGDARDHSHVEALLDGQQVTVAFTSPPYASQRAYDTTSGFQPIPPDDYVEWFTDVQANVRAHLTDNGSWFLNIKAGCVDGQRHLYVHDLVIAHVREWGWRFVDELCWVDASNGFPGSFPNRFKDAWESVFHFAANQQITFNPLANGTPTEDLLEYDSDSHMHLSADGYRVDKARTYGAGMARPSNVVRIAAGGDGSHSAAFPVKLPAWFIRAYSDPGDAVFDPFIGSGTTLIAADNEDRVAYGCEISPAYCDVILRRFQEHTGTKPTRDGKAHDFTT